MTKLHNPVATPNSPKQMDHAMAAMGRGFDVEYYPDKQYGEVYAKRYQQYNSLGKFVAWQIGLQSLNK